MPLLDLSRIRGFDPRRSSARRRKVSRLRPVKPSRKAELSYRAELYVLVGWSMAVGEALLAKAAEHWPARAAADERDRKPKTPSELNERAYKKARALTDVHNKKSVIRKNLAEVDRRLAVTVNATLGVNIAPLLARETGGAIATVMEHAAAANVDLITSIPEQHLQLVREAIVDGYSNGDRIELVAERIEEIGGITENRAKLIARDQTSKMTSAFNRVRQTSVGIEKYTWSTSRDERVRESHRALDGQVFRWDSPPTVDGEPANPGEPINCRCVGIPVIEEAAPEADAEEEQAAA